MKKLGILYNDGAEEWFDILDILDGIYYKIQRKDYYLYLNKEDGKIYSWYKNKLTHEFTPREWKIR